MTINSADIDTIVAQATPPGRGGVGIIRISGPLTQQIANTILASLPTPRLAHYGPFYSDKTKQQTIDIGLALFFPKPNSFTGEDILELHGHGGKIVMDLLIKKIINLGARLARPGEFSERAFLNNKIDLTQAEAIADLIDSQSEQAARSALRSLQGDFSKKIHSMVKSLIQLRTYVEAAIDFPEEEVDFLADKTIAKNLSELHLQLSAICQQAKQGSLLQEGIHVVIAGRPNAGKSSLLNALSRKDTAIVTEIAGTTRDILREHIQIDGMPVHIFDTAGLRESTDIVEQEGIRRAWQAINTADRVLLIVDSSKTAEDNIETLWPGSKNTLPDIKKISLIKNKIDLTNQSAQLVENSLNGYPVISLSAKTNIGIDLLRDHIKACVGFQQTSENDFIARRRHLDALQRAQQNLNNSTKQLTIGAGELLAEDLRQTQQCLSEITGEFHSDDLLGEIFSSFCIGK